ncbi:site-specific integrase [Robiginitalea aurantiaca]|uniref:Site-specific integrase n=1 Tax=Robiginitalea aurantiaca TaxID=3056915 RepID=A0ABT7WBG6_9FLAO|nr:site-specific integrase [Robiginitalea aurantiaca]MDM9630258.1 site-specific integrase [Robiginitalea aurantiaca]
MAVYLKERKLANGRKRYFLHIVNNGEHSYEWLFTVDQNDDKIQKRRLAQTIKAQRELEIESQGTNFRPKHRKKIFLYKYLDKYLEEYKKADKRIIAGTINKFKEFIGNRNQKLSGLTERQMEGYKHFLLHDAGLSGETPYNYWNRIKKILRRASREHYLDDSIFRNIRWEKKKSNDTLTKEILTESEIETLKNTPCGNEIVKRAFLFSCYTGLGYAEIKNLSWEKIKNGRLRLFREKSEKAINIKLSPSALELAGKPSQGLVFDLRRNGKFLSETAIKKNLISWMKKAEIDKNITFYCARHTFAIRLLNNGANLKTVADALGHSNTRLTVKYLNYTDKQKDSITANLN